MKRSSAKPLAGAPTPENPRRVLTIGHSTRSIEDFRALLRKYGATCIVDVRTIPRSRRNPQFNTEALPHWLAAANIGYVHLPSLGGLRRPRADSLNTGWRNASFRGFADYMQTEEFTQGVEQLLELAKAGKPALMCAEAVPWRCHRSLITDALLARGILAEHIISTTSCKLHTLTPFAVVDGTRVTYPCASDQ